MSRRGDQGELTVRIPADVERPDQILFGLSARQVAVLAVVAVLLAGGWQATRHLVPTGVFCGFAVLTGTAAVAVVVGRRDGVGLDQLLLAALRQRLAPRRLVPAGEEILPAPTWIAAPTPPLPAPLRLPAEAITGDGVIDLGRDGVAVVCACSTVNFGLLTPGEQAGLVAGFGRWLNSLTGPAQIVVRADRLDLTPAITYLEDQAPALPHPALETAALDHAAWLADLGHTRDLLRRHALLILREPTTTSTRAAAAARVLRRAQEATRALTGCQVNAQPLDGPAAAAVLASAAAPYDPPPAAGPYTALPNTPITGPPPTDTAESTQEPDRRRYDTSQEQ